MWIQTGVTVQKRLSWVVTYVTLTFDLWPWPLAWTLLWSLVITPENFMMIRWWEQSKRCDRQTDRQTENTICRAAWSQLKIRSKNSKFYTHNSQWLYGRVTIGFGRHNWTHVNQSERLLAKPKRPCTDLCAEQVGVWNRLRRTWRPKLPTPCITIDEPRNSRRYLELGRWNCISHELRCVFVVKM